MAVSATNKERFLTEVQHNIDYCVRLLSSDSVDAEVTSNVLARLQSLGRDIERTSGSLISPEEKTDLMSIVTEMTNDVEKKIQHSACSSEKKSFMVNRPQLGQLGSPRFQITKEQLEFLNTYKFSAPLMAETLHTSESTIRRRLRENNIKLRDGKQTHISDDNLDKQIKEVIGTNKRIGPNTIRLRLASENVNVSRQRVRDSCHRVDPVGCSLRSLERRNTQRTT